MVQVNEAFLQFVWSIGLFNQIDLQTTLGECIQVIRPGLLNHHSGPDFKDAHLRIDGMDWFGQVEIHINSMDWIAHGHHLDPAYNSVILHVVLFDNNECLRADGSKLPCLELASRISDETLANYQELLFNHRKIPCQARIKFISDANIINAIDRALVERLQRKSAWIEEWLKQSDGDWTTVFMAALTRCFGFGTNGDAFEMLAFELPMFEIFRSENAPFKIMAITFGTAGFLETSPEDSFQARLRQEWLFQQKRLELNALEMSVFKFMRMRPGNFPSVRLAQLSALLTNFQHLFRTILKHPDLPTMLRALDAEVDPYWLEHYHFGKKSSRHNCSISLASRQTIIINAIVPYLFEFGKFNKDDLLMEQALELLRKLPPEDNKVIREWSEIGIDCTSAFDSQALLELRSNYCDKRKCLDCQIGSSILRVKTD